MQEFLHLENLKTLIQQENTKSSKILFQKSKELLKRSVTLILIILFEYLNGDAKQARPFKFQFNIFLAIVM